ncbi:hypothetical protein B0H14DRAFT_2981069 [Mycena olivaceomarginata]|nr:hypothetical protein B0H14DRAFT_2981069 [Mycena olivaceomarginata]
MPSLIPLDSVLGAAFIGILVSTAVYGITCLQGYIYYTENSSGDKQYLKTFPSLLDTFHVILLGIFYYYYSVTNFGDYIELQAISNCKGKAQVVVEDIIALMVQFFFAYRIYQLSKNWIIPAIICILSIGQFGRVGVKLKESARTKTWTISGMAISAACDVVITASMIYYLWSEKQQIKLSRGMNRTINSLMRYSLNTGISCASSRLSSLITHGARFPDDFVENETAFIYGPFFFVLSRSMLNTRHHLREKLNGDVELYASGQPAYPSAIAFASGGTHTTASNMDV